VGREEKVGFQILIGYRLSVNHQLEVSLSGTLTLHTVNFLVRRLRPVIEACDAQDEIEICLDMSGLSFITPTPLATLMAAVLHMRRSQGVIASQVLRPRTQDLDMYLTRMGFYELLEVPVRYPWRKRDPSGRFVELIEVDSIETCEQVVGELMAILEAQGYMRQEASNAIWFALTELIENVFHHAASHVNAIVCAQTYQRP
jgi:anti-anti-sigma regulatory factor